MDSYQTIKLIHISTVIITLLLLITRVMFLLYRPQLLSYRALKLLPHINDTVLLLSAFSLLVIAGILPGLDHLWLLAKIIVMVLYIITGLLLFKKAKTRFSIVSLLLIALLFYAYIVQTAISKNINPFIN